MISILTKHPEAEYIPEHILYGATYNSYLQSLFDTTKELIKLLHDRLRRNEATGTFDDDKMMDFWMSSFMHKGLLFRLEYAAFHHFRVSVGTAGKVAAIEF